MLTREFLNDYGLYQKFAIPIDSAIRTEHGTYRGPALLRHCGQCREQTTWNQLKAMEFVLINNPHFHNLKDSFQRYARAVRDQGISQTRETLPRGDNTYSIRYQCEGCKQNQIVYIVRFVMELVSTEDWPPKIHMFAQKVGQWPAPWIRVPPQMMEWLGEYSGLFQKGATCEAFGHGIGAFGYYRRILEDLIDKLLEDIAELFDNHPQKEEYLAQLAVVQASKNHSDKIKMVNDLVPEILKRDSKNPLGLLHAALSVGLHDLSDEECLELAKSVRQALARLNRHIELAMTEEADFPEHIKIIKKKLDKNKRKNGTPK